MKVLRGIIASPFWLLAFVGSIILMLGLKGIARIYRKDAGTLFLRKLLGSNAENWVVTTGKCDVE